MRDNSFLRLAASSPSPRLLPCYRPTRSRIIRARLTLSETTVVSRGEGRLISGSRARRTAAMIAAAMTRVDVHSRLLLHLLRPGLPLPRNRSLHFTHQSITDRTVCGPVCTRDCPERSPKEDSFSSPHRVDTGRQSSNPAWFPPGPGCSRRTSCTGW
jgi:hypothetical protein